MRLITGTTEFETTEATAISLGKFEGLHVGHQLLVNRILKKKEEGLKALIFTFDFGERSTLLLPEERRKSPGKMGRGLSDRVSLCGIHSPYGGRGFCAGDFGKEAACKISGCGDGFSFRP